MFYRFTEAFFLVSVCVFFFLMILTDDSIQAFKVQLQQSIIVCSERGLFYASKW